MTVRIKHVDAFTEVPFTGNAAGVVVDAALLSEHTMQAIAREMALSETAFILPPSTPAADLRIRWFTPTNEVALCGHATVASFHALAEDGAYGMARDGEYPFRLETRSGVLPVLVIKRGDEIEVRFGLPVPQFRVANEHREEVASLLGVHTGLVDPVLPMVVWEDLFVPFKDLHTVFSLEPDFLAMSRFLRRHSFRGICVFTRETVEPSSAVHSRFFTPSEGINEDPVTGSANGPLGAYCVQFGLVPQNEDIIYLVGEQGDAIGRKGRVGIRIGCAGGTIQSVEIAGKAVSIFAADLRIV